MVDRQQGKGLEKATEALKENTLSPGMRSLWRLSKERKSCPLRWPGKREFSFLDEHQKGLSVMFS